VKQRPPTDFELLKAIYARYRDEFPSYVQAAEGSRVAKILVPIDLHRIATDLGVDVDSVFGRLYFHLQPKYGQDAGESGKPRKVFFTPVAGQDLNCVNFPLLEAVLASLWQQQRRDQLAIATAVVSFAIALGALIVSIIAIA
jgi:hypothetical protein